MDFSMFENMRFGNDMNHRTENDMIQGNTDSVSRFPKETPLAMAYVPMQQWSTTYDEAEALSVGTIFPELNLPFEPEEGCYGQR